MKKQRVKAVAVATMVTATTLFGGEVFADQTLNQIFEVGESKVNAGLQSQQRIDRLQEQTNALLQEFKTVNKQIEGLRVYNAQLEKQIAKQLEVIKDLEESIDNVTIIERQIQPLVLRMLEGLTQFISLDVPFHIEQRTEELEKVTANMDRADISVAEKFRQVLELYKIEAEYGRKISTYETALTLDGVEREVNVLQVGRIALLYQTKDTKLSGAWDASQGAWTPLDSGDYRSAILKGIRIAKKQASVDILELPILAPEAAQ
ncbi:DUF3450 domain-containing protein [Halioxenophilus sp. WMMB6]|uniref:DUF3450 domain-containing protein n=1 Tax=Halioxenophilus sp. WMMB6 TaxID=3073815 RepID=UPI00295E65C3|nr:DUF3450 domain-containing protein [Halioxenophilus sp. WMMB6]